MKIIRQLLLRLLGLEAFLRIVSRIYIRAVSAGLWKKKYPELFYLSKLIKSGDTCIDIGANLGYYSVFLSRLVGNSGKVYAVEPIPLFAKIWRDNTLLSMRKNLTLFPYALGETNRFVKMSIPIVDGVMHHGMTKINDNNQVKEIAEEFDVEMKNPDELFASIEKVDFVKIDVEGYEQFVLSSMLQTITKHKPIIQAELGGDENRAKVITLLTGLGYKTHILKNGVLAPATDVDIQKHNADFYFII